MYTLLKRNNPANNLKNAKETFAWNVKMIVLCIRIPTLQKLVKYAFKKSTKTKFSISFISPVMFDVNLTFICNQMLNIFLIWIHTDVTTLVISCRCDVKMWYQQELNRIFIRNALICWNTHNALSCMPFRIFKMNKRRFYSETQLSLAEIKLDICKIS